MREKILNFIAYALLAALAVSLFYTQIWQYPYYIHLSRNNSLRIIPVEAPRGNIYDRNGKLMVGNRLSFDVAVIYQEFTARTKTMNFLSDYLGISKRNLLKAVEKSSRAPYAPHVICKDIKKDKAIALEECFSDTRGLVITTSARRSYPYGESGSHIFGYLGEITERELVNLKEYGYKKRDLIGKDGLEKYYDAYLAGVDGGLQTEIDSKGRHLKTLGVKEASPGRDLFTTIDIDLQDFADKALKGKAGAIIAMNPANGGIFALASSPSFDPNIFVKEGMTDERLRVIADKMKRPLMNRAISCMYPPGSIFKIVMASAALETKKISSHTTFTCGGFFMSGKARFDCWKEAGHGPEDVTLGLANSCNVFFYNTGKVLGADNIETFARLFGFGRPAGIDLPDEAKGVVPGRMWKRLYKNSGWYAGDTLNYSIGQGYLLVTPLQIVDMTAVIANNGYLVKPFFVKKIGNDNLPRPMRKVLGLRREVIKKVRDGLFKVVNNENGTGSRARVEGLAIAGKTGTAQTSSGKTHAWFTGYAPFENPKICLVVFLEHGGKGALEPADIAKAMFEEAKKLGFL